MLSAWREEFLEGGLAALKRRTEDPKAAALERELKRDKRLVGDLMMDKEELLEMCIARFEGELAFPEAEVEFMSRACSVFARLA